METKKEHAENLLKCLSQDERWPSTPTTYMVGTEKNYYLNFIGEDGDTTIRYAIDYENMPEVEANDIINGVNPPKSYISLKEEMLQLNMIRAMPRNSRRVAMREYKKQSKKNSWALKVKEGLKLEWS
jgi:hypothetical protein